MTTPSGLEALVAALPVDIDASNPDNDGDPTVKVHQQHHDVVHAALKALFAPQAPVQVPALPRVVGLSDFRADLQILSAADGALYLPSNDQLALPVGFELSFFAYGAGKVTVAGAPAVKTIGVRGVSNYASTSALTSHPLPMPAGVVAGDGLLVHISAPLPGGTWTPPAGFVQAGPATGPVGAGSLILVKPNAVAADGGVNKTLQVSAATAITATVVALSNVDTTDFLDGMALSGSSTSNVTPSLLTSYVGCLELAFKSYAGAAVTAYPTPSAASAAAGLVSVGGAYSSMASGNNSSEGVARGGAQVPAGTAIGQRTWSNPGGFGSTRTASIKPATTTTSVVVRAAGGATASAAQYAAGVAKKIGPDEWFVTGYLA